MLLSTSNTSILKKIETINVGFQTEHCQLKASECTPSLPSNAKPGIRYKQRYINLLSVFSVKKLSLVFQVSKATKVSPIKIFFTIIVDNRLQKKKNSV